MVMEDRLATRMREGQECGPVPRPPLVRHCSELVFFSLTAIRSCQITLVDAIRCRWKPARTGWSSMDARH